MCFLASLTKFQMCIYNIAFTSATASNYVLQMFFLLMIH